MLVETDDALRTRAESALGDAFLRKAVRFTVERLRTGKAESTAALGRWEEWRERGRHVRTHVIEHLDYYLEEFSGRLLDGGHHVHFAADAAEAAAIVTRIAREQRAKLVVKSKSMVSEELHLNQHLADAGIEALETDLGEWIVQLAQEMPSHLIIPAIHKNRHQVQALFEAEGHVPLSPETCTLAAHARRRLRERFAEADIGVTGCNFAIADTGSVVLFTNEGNGRMVTTLPKTHIVVMGMERILPTLADLELMANLLPRSATGQKITTYVNLLSGARGEGEVDGARELHVVILDNGRSAQLGHPDYQEILNCIRCGACLNVCPVYRQIGGHAYASVYSGPIGAVLTPLLSRDPRARELANASTLCGACTEACPVKIPLHDMLVHLRRDNAQRLPDSSLEKQGFALWSRVFSRPWLYRFALRVARLVERFVLRRSPRRRLPMLPAVEGWARYRSLPLLARKSFRERFEERSRKRP